MIKSYSEEPDSSGEQGEELELEATEETLDEWEEVEALEEAVLEAAAAAAAHTLGRNS